MSLVGLLDVLATIGFGSATVFTLRLSRRQVGKTPVALLFSCMALYFLYIVCNTLEHLSITSQLDQYEEYFEVLSIPLFVFAIYSLRVVIETRERARVELELRRSRQEWVDTFQAIGQPTLVLDPEYKIVRANRAAMDALNKPLDEIIGRPCFEVMCGRTRPGKDCPVNDLLVGESTGPVVTEVEVLGGVHLVSCTPFFDEDGRLEKMIHISTDITERRRLEEQLLQSQKMEAVGQLAGGVAHDFNNLLSVILGYTQLALETLEARHPLRDNLQEIDRAAERAADLTRQLLTFSRRQVLEPKPLDLNTLVGGTEKMLRRLIGEDVELVTVFDPDPCPVTADPGQLEQVVVNLAVNARDAMPQGGRLTIETANVLLDDDYARRHSGVTPGRHVMLAVSDTGMGMTEEVRTRIFEPFFTTKDQGQGTGLGLATVYGIVQQSGGHIYVYSEPGQGTTFKVYLPRNQETQETGDAAPQTDPVARGSETVLVVEDDDLMRTIACRSLANYGYQILEAANGGEAVQVCEQTPGDIDLVLSDVVLPLMSGPQLIERLKATRPGLRVLFMSGYAEKAIVNHGVLDEAVDFISKPFSPQALAQKVRQVLNDTGG